MGTTGLVNILKIHAFVVAENKKIRFCFRQREEEKSHCLAELSGCPWIKK